MSKRIKIPVWMPRAAPAVAMGMAMRTKALLYEVDRQIGKGSDDHDGQSLDSPGPPNHS